MENLQMYMDEYRLHLEKGWIQKAYLGLQEYISSLRTLFQKKHLAFDVPGNIYQGYMDMTYFSIIPPALKQRKLKIAVVFLYDPFKFDIWLSGYNRQVQAHYWKLLRGMNLQPNLVEDPVKADAILQHTLVVEPDFADLEGLTRQIESGTPSFISHVEKLIVEVEGG
jgi:hypothetical protein